MKQRFTEQQVIKVLKVLEAENTRLKRLLAESMLTNAALKDVFGRKW